MFLRQAHYLYIWSLMATITLLHSILLPLTTASILESTNQKSNMDDTNNALTEKFNRPANFFGNAKLNQRSIYGFGPHLLQISRSKIPIELDMLVKNNEAERSKRFDDYGYMKFGKRGGEDQFDDYGHMRFGRK